MSGLVARIVISIDAMFWRQWHVEITRRYVDSIPILDLAGRFLVSTDRDGTLLRAAVAKLVSERRVNLLVHLARVTDIDAHGLGELAWGSTTLRRSGGRMALIAPCPWVRRLLALTKLDTILTIYDSERHAIAGTLSIGRNVIDNTLKRRRGYREGPWALVR
jgi:anti-anti-sigma factor